MIELIQCTVITSPDEKVFNYPVQCLRQRYMKQAITKDKPRLKNDYKLGTSIMVYVITNSRLLVVCVLLMEYIKHACLSFKLKKDITSLKFGGVCCYCFYMNGTFN